MAVFGILKRMGLAGFCKLCIFLQFLTLPGSRSADSENTNVIITMKEPVGSIIQSYSQMTFNSREERVSAMTNALKTASTASQAPLASVLNSFGAKSQSYWLTNQVFVQDANPLLVSALQSLDVVRMISKDETFPLNPIVNKNITETEHENVTQWNLKQIGVEKLWNLGITGEGIIVAGIDTGVRGTHAGLRDNYIGTDQYGWYDPIMYTAEPNDKNGHGTHTMGTMVGVEGIGAAPNAKWMACKGCGMLGCQQHDLIACGQYVLCPSDPYGGGNCTNVPHIINNSLGAAGGQTWYDDVLAAWDAAGIIAIFAAGNTGPKCETTNSPGDNDWAIAVGATDDSDKLTNFSSRGPKFVKTEGPLDGHDKIVFVQMVNNLVKKKKTTDGIKPDISAPGHKIYSAWKDSDTSYKIISGTSMASPLVAGATALLMSKNPELTMDELKDLMFSTAETNLPSSDSQCGNVPETMFPNNMYGHGRVDIYKAYKKMLKRMDKKDEDKNNDAREAEMSFEINGDENESI